MDDAQLHITVAQLNRRVSLLEAKVDFMLKQLKIEFVEDPQDPYMAQVSTLVAQGKVIDAIKFYREKTGVDLATAKAYVDGLPRPAK